MSQVPSLYFCPFLCKLGLKMTVKINYLLQFQTIYHTKLSYQTKFYFTAAKNTRVKAFPIWEVLNAPYCRYLQLNLVQSKTIKTGKEIALETRTSIDCFAESILRRLINLRPHLALKVDVN